jgi:hypothetical protein
MGLSHGSERDLMSRFRRNLLLSSFGGLLACGLVAAASAWMVNSSTLTPPFPHPLLALILAIILGGFSLAEIPLMVLAMRRLVAERPENLGVTWGLNSLYVFFAATYGVPVLLITGSFAWGLALCGLGVVRFASSLVFIQETPQ